MPDGPFKSMTPDPSGLPRSLKHLAHLNYEPGASTRCEKCGAAIYAGNWPWCGKGGKADHERD